ncbi:MAG: hypothetical protein QUS35_04680 [bacterium]|nr:hypothetical protein [bacterium]
MKSAACRALRIACLSAVLLSAGCGDWITDPGPQPRYLDGSGHTPALNVIGVLRPDGGGLSMSFVHLERAYPFNETPDETAVPDAEVTVTALPYPGETAADSIPFFYSNPESVFPSFEYRNDGFFPEPGRTYSLSCRRGVFPELTGTTVIPRLPRIVPGSLSAETGALSFTLERDSLAALVDVYWIGADFEEMTRILRPETGDVLVRIRTGAGEKASGILRIYAYDLNLSEYLTYNLTIKPNTYHSSYSTVTGGFGCFGSLNVLELEWPQENRAGHESLIQLHGIEPSSRALQSRRGRAPARSSGSDQ